MSKLQRVIHLFSSNSIHFIQPLWEKEQWDIASRVLFNGNLEEFSESPKLLENDLSKLSCLQFSRSFNLARSAIQIALESFDFPENSEVILPSFSCAGVITPVLAAGFIPVLVDIDQDFNIQASSVKQALSPSTRAIILPHLSGKLARDFFEILDIAQKNKLKTIVDASQALGLTVDGKSVVTFGDVGIYSFNGGKLIPNSGGGVLVTNNNQVNSFCESREIPDPNNKPAKKRILRFIFKRSLARQTYPFYSLADAYHNFVYSRQKTPKGKGNNGYFCVEKIHPIEAALAQTQFKYIPEIIHKRQQNAKKLIDSNILQKLGFQIPDLKDNIFIKFLVTHEDPILSNRVRRYLIENGIETEQSYTPLTLRPLSKNARLIDTPNTDKFWKGAFSIPVNPLLETEDIDRIIQVLSNKIP
jgi:dTDP-4-amino-4,6-dideoxygalactose transaminase